jgi:hypothetical protein
MRTQNRGGKVKLKRVFLIGAAAVLLVMVGSAAWACTLTIADLTEGTVTATFSSEFSNVSKTEQVEYASGSGTVSWANFPTGITKYVILTEANGTASDFLKVWASSCTTLKFVFESDGYASFASDVAALAANTPKLQENGLYQDVSSYFSSILGCSGVIIKVGSDVEDNPVPLPPTALLLGTGILGLVGLRSFRKG